MRLHESYTIHAAFFVFAMIAILNHCDGPQGEIALFVLPVPESMHFCSRQTSILFSRWFLYH
jgi:hypothetical protein